MISGYIEKLSDHSGPPARPRQTLFFASFVGGGVVVVDRRR